MMSLESEKVEVASSLIDDIESGRASFEQIVLKASRLARKVKNERVTEILTFEKNGYPSDNARALALLEVTNRKIPDTDKLKNMYHPQSAAEIDNTIRGYTDQIDALKAFIPTGQFAQMQLANQINQIRDLSAYRGQKIKVVSTVKSLIYDFALDVYNSSTFNLESSQIFSNFQKHTENLLEEHLEIFEKWPSVFSRLKDGDTEALSHAMTSCRRIIDGFSKIILKEVDGEFDANGEKIDCSAPMTKNRIRVFLKININSVSRVDRLTKTLKMIYDRVSTGVHSDISYDDAEAIILSTYLFIGEIIKFVKKTD
jgi:AbiTii